MDHLLDADLSVDALPIDVIVVFNHIVEHTDRSGFIIFELDRHGNADIYTSLDKNIKVIASVTVVKHDFTRSKLFIPQIFA